VNYVCFSYFLVLRRLVYIFIPTVKLEARKHNGTFQFDPRPVYVEFYIFCILTIISSECCVQNVLNPLKLAVHGASDL